MRTRKPTIYKIKYLALFFGRELQHTLKYEHREDTPTCIEYVNSFMSGYAEFWAEKIYPYPK